jgi:adenosylcobinamide-GDP ribazoletransferase
MRDALAFLTPLGGARTPDGRTLSWFPLAGALIGAVVGASWWAAGEIWTPAVAAAIVIAVDLAVTGMLHIDGVADSADGLVAHMPRERRLEVMAEPSVGAFGIAAVAVILLLRFAALGAMEPDIALLASLWCTSRTVMAVTARAMPYARPAGLASAFAGQGWWPVAAYGGAGALLLGAVAGEPVAVVVASLAGGAVALGGRFRLGGYTGDVLGAAGVIAETAGLLVAAGSW